MFFSNNKVFASLLLAVSFFNPYAGFSGVVAALMAIAVSKFTGLNKTWIEEGLYSYNALIIGIGLGTMYTFNPAFWFLLLVIVIFSVVLSLVFQFWLGRYGLPFLTIPFVFCFWLVILVTRDFAAMDLSLRNIYWINDLYALGSLKLVNFIMFMENLDIPPLLATFFRALSSLYFQNNILAGILIAGGIMIHSRILFSLVIIGFVSAFVFNHIVIAHPEGINYYLLGGNFILVSMAVGGFFTIPSAHSYLWAVVSVPITFLIVMGLGKVTGLWNLPVYSMPFSITVLFLLYFFSLKNQKGRVVLTPLQLYTPEKNLYNYLNNKERLMNTDKVRLQLPVIGEWMVSQGYDGNITHKGDWNKALDFIIVDSELKTYDKFGLDPRNFYCYGKPVLAPADGFVEYIEDFIEDNEIGRINQKQNWGNSIIIKHAEGLYSKLSHLHKYSFKVKAGDYVHQGNVIAAVGNSGRSPEPHLHFQVQTSPYIGSKTFAYPLAQYIAVKDGKTCVKEFTVPSESEIVYNAPPSPVLKQAFEFLPGLNLSVQADGLANGHWEVFTDAFNNNYIYCHTSKALAYFRRNESAFYFTAFTGDKNSLLYYFYVACYKIYLSTDPVLPAIDIFPLQLSASGSTKWLQDFVSPFFIFSRLHYESLNKPASAGFINDTVIIESRQVLQYLSFKKVINQSVVSVNDGRISSFTFYRDKQEIKAICILKNY